MKCPRCKSTQISKNGRHHGKQNYICKRCRRQFVEFYNPKGYSNDVKRICLRMYVNGMGFRGIERVTGINHNTVINWVRAAGLSLPDAPDSEEIPEITELDELQTFIGKKKNKVWLWTAVNKKSAGILAWVVGNRSAKTFENLWLIVSSWQSFWYATDGYAVYAKFIDDIDHIVSKTYITRVEGENTRLRHYLARLHRKTLCYSLVKRNVRSFPSLATSLSEVLDYPSSCLNHDLIVQCLQEWDVCVKAAARDDREMLLGLSSGGRSALHLIGGLHKLGMASEEDLRWLKKEFVSVWKSTPADVKSLPQSNTSDYERLEVVRW